MCCSPFLFATQPLSPRVTTASSQCWDRYARASSGCALLPCPSLCMSSAASSYRRSGVCVIVMHQVRVQTTCEIQMQSALRPNNSHEACCCFLVFEPADADGAENSDVLHHNVFLASQHCSCRHFRFCLSAFITATRHHNAG